MGIEQERSALRAILEETDVLSGLAKSFYVAVTHDPRVKARAEERKPTPLEAARFLKPAGT